MVFRGAGEIEILKSVINGERCKIQLTKGWLIVVGEKVESRVMYEGSHKTLMVGSAAQRKERILYAENLEARDKDNGPSHIPLSE